MKDLKYLLEFENLLEDADNALVRQAQEEGQYAIGYTCYHMPEVLLNVDNCFSTRIRAPRTGSVDIATYYMSNYTCEFSRALLERGIEGGYQFLDAVAGVDACSAMNRTYEHFEVLQCNTKPHFFVTHTDVPYKIESYTVDQVGKQSISDTIDTTEKKYDFVEAITIKNAEVGSVINTVKQTGARVDDGVHTAESFLKPIEEP